LPSRIYTLQRYKDLVQQIDIEVYNYSEWASEIIAAHQKVYGEVGLLSSTEAIDSILAEFYDPTLTYYKLPVDAIESMVGLAGDGSTLVTHLEKSIADSISGVTQALIQGVTVGENPTVVANWMVDGLSLGLNRALNIARTEQLRVFREATRDSYKQSRIVSGYRRLATHDSRVCAGCLFSEGDFYILEEHFYEHPQGRCALLPEIINVDSIRWQTGQEWFASQDPFIQEKIVGAERLNLWKKGEVQLTDMVSLRENTKWGNSLVPTPLYVLKGYESSEAMSLALASTPSYV
jgi:hypothetical protein